MSIETTFVKNERLKTNTNNVKKIKARPSKSLGSIFNHERPISNGVYFNENNNIDSNGAKDNASHDEKVNYRRNRTTSLIVTRTSQRISGDSSILESPSVLQAVMAKKPGVNFNNIL